MESKGTVGFVSFNTIEQVQDFICAIRQIGADVDACHGSYIVDAKSILGLLSLSLGTQIDLILHSEDPEITKVFEQICEEYKY